MNAFNQSELRSHLGPRQVRPLVVTGQDAAADYRALSDLGINFPQTTVAAMIRAMAMDDGGDIMPATGITTPAITTPVQFLQNWLPGFVRVITAARKIDELVGITTVGSWEDEEVVQGVLENVGYALPYGDYTNVPLASWNVNFERRTVVRFELGILVGVLEEARAARVRMNSAAEKRASAALDMEIQRNLIGFYGYNNGTNRTYGFLNEPNLPAYWSLPNGASNSPAWSSKTFLEITADIRHMAATLQTQSQDNINPESVELTLALPTSVYQYLSVTSDYGISVRDWINKTYPRMRIVSAPQLNEANGGETAAYLYAETVDDGATDDSRVWLQVVPAKFQALGVEKQAKGYVEDYANATAGVMLKRPYAVTRASGL